MTAWRPVGVLPEQALLSRQSPPLLALPGPPVLLLSISAQRSPQHPVPAALLPHTPPGVPCGRLLPWLSGSPAVPCPLCLFCSASPSPVGSPGGCVTFPGWLGETCCLWPWVMRGGGGWAAGLLSVWPSPSVPTSGELHAVSNSRRRKEGKSEEGTGALSLLHSLFLFPISQATRENEGGRGASWGVGTGWQPGAGHTQPGLAPVALPAPPARLSLALPVSNTTAQDTDPPSSGGGGCDRQSPLDPQGWGGEEPAPSERRCPS